MPSERPKPFAREKPPSLLNDPEAAVCPQFPLFRHPVFRKLKTITYLGIPAIVVAALVTLGPEAGIGAAGLSLLFLLSIPVVLFLAEQHARAAAALRTADRLRRGWQFVCPGCLKSGPVRHACGACNEELEPFVILTRGLYLNDCAYCHARVFGRLWGQGARPNAFCSDCGHATDARHHRRRICVSAVLDSRDLESLRTSVHGSLENGFDLPYFFRDTGDVVHYVLDLGSGEGDALPARHAARQVRGVWMDSVLDDPLRLGEALDRLIRRADLGEGRRREIVLCTPRAELPPSVRNVVEGRFSAIDYGVTAHRFFFGREIAGSSSQTQSPIRLAHEEEEPDLPQLTKRAG